MTSGQRFSLISFFLVLYVLSTFIIGLFFWIRGKRKNEFAEKVLGFVFWLQGVAILCLLKLL